MIVLADPFQGKAKNRRSDARPARGDRRFLQIDARCGKGRPQRFWVFHGVVGVQKRLVGDVDRTGNVARTQAGARFGFIALETAQGARVDDRVIAQLGGSGHLGDIPDQMRLTLHGDVTIAHHRRHIFDRAAFGLPLR